MVVRKTRLASKPIARQNGFFKVGSTKPRIGSKKRLGVGVRHIIVRKPKPKKKQAGGLFWSMKKCDRLFSIQIRARDGRCMHPQGTENCKMLQNSHYIGRANKAVRYDPENCVAICYFHHFKSKDLGFEYQKQTIEKHGFDGQYTLWMKSYLGPERFAALIERSKVDTKQCAALLSFQNNHPLTLTKLLATQTPIE